MIKVIIVYLIIIVISFIVGLNIRLNNTKSSLHRGTYIEDVSLDKKCQGGICPLPEEYKDGSNQ